MFILYLIRLLDNYCSVPVSQKTTAGNELLQPSGIMSTIREEADGWQQDRNNKKAKINWQFNTRDARIKLKRLCPTLLY